MFRVFLMVALEKSNNRIVNDRIEKTVKVRRFMNNLLYHRGCAKIS